MTVVLVKGMKGAETLCNVFRTTSVLKCHFYIPFLSWISVYFCSTFLFWGDLGHCTLMKNI